MIKKHSAVIAFFTWMALPVSLFAQDARTVLTNAAKAMGAETVRTLQYSGSGSNAGVGQNINPDAPWPLVPIIG